MMTDMKRFTILLAALLLPLAALAEEPATGRLLVATSDVNDPNFVGTVVLLIHHGDDGSLGLFLNRPTWVDGGDAFAELAPFDVATRTLFLGGPIAMTQLIALTARPGSSEGTTAVLDGLYVTADIASLEALGPDVDKRIYAGHAAWSPDQLQQEIDDHLWLVVDGSPDLVFRTRPEALAERAAALAASGLTAAR